ncbi:hypothetical protein M5K25_001650 [Dendrobium thyrsiflorum]|uniref:Transmembrane protein n=1 Tax=Dendrobium thyrsiflorum TaxID=117978 RepID=A0ABD0W359_DENTH
MASSSKRSRISKGSSSLSRNENFLSKENEAAYESTLVLCHHQEGEKGEGLSTVTRRVKKDVEGFIAVTRRVKKDVERFFAVTGEGEKGRGTLPSLGTAKGQQKRSSCPFAVLLLLFCCTFAALYKYSTKW